jgi:hypothetical protein
MKFLAVNVEIAIVFDKTGLIVWCKGATISDRLPAASIVILYGVSRLRFFQTHKFNLYDWFISHVFYIMKMAAEGFF